MWFGREGRHGVCRVVNSCCDFQTMTPNAYIFMSLFHKQFISRSSKEKKKDNKKASSNILVQTSIKDK